MPDAKSRRQQMKDPFQGKTDPLPWKEFWKRLDGMRSDRNEYPDNPYEHLEELLRYIVFLNDSAASDISYEMYSDLKQYFPNPTTLLQELSELNERRTFELHMVTRDTTKMMPQPQYTIENAAEEEQYQYREGDYVVRPSNNKRGKLVVSLVYNNSVQHTFIRRNQSSPEHSLFICNVFEKPQATCPSLLELLKHAEKCETCPMKRACGKVEEKSLKDDTELLRNLKLKLASTGTSLDELCHYSDTDLDSVLADHYTDVPLKYRTRAAIRNLPLKPLDPLPLEEMKDLVADLEAKLASSMKLCDLKRISKSEFDRLLADKYSNVYKRNKMRRAVQQIETTLATNPSWLTDDSLLSDPTIAEAFRNMVEAPPSVFMVCNRTVTTPNAKTIHKGTLIEVTNKGPNHIVYDGEKIELMEDESPAFTELRQVIGDTLEIDEPRMKVQMERHKELGRGSYGIVYSGLVIQGERQGENVAIKQIMRKLLGEINLMAQLQHPNIVRYYGSLQDRDCICIVMERMQESLDQRIPTMEDHLIGKHSYEILQGLNYMHSIPAVHRDIKPSNILIGGGVAKLSDFGSAKKFEGGSGDATHNIRGSPYYIAPESVIDILNKQRHQCSTRSDMWSLGCTFLEMQTKQRPWKGQLDGDAMHIMYAIANKQITPNIPDDTPDLFKDVIKSLLKREADERATCSDLLRHPYFVEQRRNLEH
eukprot:Sspe_Gene.78920::Locus_49428_Transcript_1_1_Confidence_1.000_Length_2239::g.78920::m.78920